MASQEEIREARLKKLNNLRDKGVDPYPISVNRTHTLKEISDFFEKLSSGKKNISVCGRIMSIRPHGGIVFGNLDDGSAKFQFLLKKEDLERSDDLEFFLENFDIGDFISLSGSLFVTKRNERTVLVKEFSMIAKSLRALPDKWHGLQDVEERFRHRYLDTLMSSEVKERFIVRSKIISEIRSILSKNDFLEVETPMLQNLPGGASALPFKTHHNALDMDLFLRIAPELYLKKLLVGGFPKVFELNRNFRNEGIDVTHNPEFTMLEFYEAYSDSKEQMSFVEKIIKDLVKKVFDKNVFDYGGEVVDFSKSFSKISYFDLLQKYALMSNPGEMSLSDLVLKASQLGVKTEEGDPKERIIDNIYKKLCRPKIIQPTFVTDYPADYLPLAKRSTENKNLVDAFQLVVGGLEVVKAFSELNDPVDQAERFKVQDQNKISGDKEAQSTDDSFIEALEYGMPPAGGVGIGIDRLVMLLTNQKNIREVILFPTLRPKG